MLQMIWDGARRELERLYEDTCTVVAQEPEADAETGIMKTAEKALYTDLPCRLSFASSPASTDGMAPQIGQSVKLFLSPDVDIPPGCRIEVHRGGRILQYRESGVPAVYPTHQEITLSLYEETP